MPPVEISLPSSLLSFFASVAVVWTLASLVVVILALRAMLTLPASYAAKADLLVLERRFETWLQDVERRHSEYFDEARKAREEMQRTIQTLSGEIHGVLGELRASRGGRA